MSKLLFTVLCSSKIEILYRSIESIENQINTNISYDIFIIVNSLNNIFYNKVENEFGNKYQVIRTESNGRPGKGHNSCIDIFKNAINYSELFILDGDDQLYPYALYQLERVKQLEKPDIINLTMYDSIKISNLKNKYTRNEIEVKYKIELNNNNIPIFDEYFYKDINNKPGDPLELGLDIVGTSTRMIYITRKSLKILYNYYPIYDEDMKVYDDLKPFYISLDQYGKGNINVVFLNDEHIYLYSSLPNSISHTDNDNSWDEIILNSYKEILPICKNFKKINDVEFTRLDNRLFDNTYKKGFCDDFINNLLIPKKYVICEKKSILFIDISGNYSKYSIENDGLGGTESAFYFLANKLTKIYDVHIACNIKERHITNTRVNILPFNIDLINNNIDYIIIQGTLDIIPKLCESKIFIWIHHDINVEFIKNQYSNVTPDIVKKINGFIFVSNWQRDRYINTYNLPFSKSYVIQNSISEKCIEYINKYIYSSDLSYKEDSLCFISKPYRGLRWIKPLFDLLKKYIPQLKIKIFSSFKTLSNKGSEKPLNLEDLNQLDLDSYDKFYLPIYKLLIETEGVEFYGFTNQDFLFQEMNKCKILFYPTYFEETCCTSLLEAMACKCNILCTNVGALKETVNYFYNPIDINISQYLDKIDNINQYINTPLDINELTEKNINEILNKTLNYINNFYSEDNKYKLTKQLEYIKNNCTYDKSKHKFIDILNSDLHKFF